MNQHFDFLRESVRNLRTTGSVARSSKYLCRGITSKIDPSKARVVVELGAGDGVITAHILERLPSDARLFVFEINPVFVEKLREAFPNEPRLTLIHDTAEHMGRYFEKEGIQSVDYIISGIPFVMLPESLALSITRTCRQWLAPSGLFIQFHYSPLLLGFYRKIFGNVQVDFIPLNIPPAFIVSCEKTDIV